MWDTAFNISMLTEAEVIIHCPNKDLVGELMDLLAEHGVRWRGFGEVPNEDNSSWGDNKEETCYWVEDNKLSYAEKEYAEKYSDGEFRNHIKCTFYGTEPDIEISDASFEGIISI